MSYKNTQSKPGPQLKRSVNDTNRTGRSDGTGKIPASGRGNSITTHHQHSKDSPEAKAQGREPKKGLVRRGYVLNESTGQIGGNVKDATQRPGGGSKLKKL